ncbi:calcium-binding protein [Leptolyngbya valderiana BDU 20041]|nr:calcium-binding protein [Leptolyngbya valderiana BDU 20041]
MTELTLDPTTQLVQISDDETPTISVLWDRAIQTAVINASPGPTIASRAYGMVHTAMFDAWAAYSPDAIGTQLWDNLQRPAAENTEANKIEAMSFAAYRVASDLFPEEVAVFDALMAQLGLDPSNTTEDATTAAGIGNLSAEALLEFRRNDGSNQLGNYADTTGYAPTNTSPEAIAALDRWTPEHVPIDDETASLQSFLTPQWGQVIPFALSSGDVLRPVEPEPFLLPGVNATVDVSAKTIALDDGMELAISSDLVGTVINPAFVEQTQEIVDFSANLTDEQKLIAEFWEDGGGTSFPPGTWMTFGQFVSARDDRTLDEDASMFFALGNAVFDAGIATWESKVFHDYVRPVRAVRELGALGLIGTPGTDDVTSETGFVIEAWSPDRGTQTILAENFLTYQTPGSDPSPPFAEYTSGHSAFSAASAEVLRSLSGSDAFGASVTFQPGESRFEPGSTPQQAVTLAWNTFTEAADEAGISRLYGGIHFEDGDLNGRTLGRQVGTAASALAQIYAVLASSLGLRLLRGTDEADTIAGENFTMETDEAVLIAGFGGNDALTGTANDDLLFGNTGTDTVQGGDGSDSLFGGQQDDVIEGGAGDDRISGDLGNDTLTGGGGSDRFVMLVNGGTDTIVDFEVGVDTILPLDLDATTFVLTETDTGVAIAAGDVVTVLSGVSGVVLGDLL